MATPRAPKIPILIYGTAWKKDHTRALVRQALLAGFRGVDTAAQPKHYQEDLVGQGIRDAINDGVCKREDLYIQTKYTSIQGQDPRKMPYDPNKSITEQVSTSIKSSLRNLRHSDTDASKSYIDCLVLHSPLPSRSQTLEAWRAMESHVPDQARTLGISNIYDPVELQSLYEAAKVKPTVVQNRFTANTGYDRDIRSFCVQKGMVYQSFWTLTANPNLLTSKPVTALAQMGKVSPPVALYSLVLGLGNTSVLNGTTNEKRMTDDVSGIETINQWQAASTNGWQDIQNAFERLVTV